MSKLITALDNHISEIIDTEINLDNMIDNALSSYELSEEQACSLFQSVLSNTGHTFEQVNKRVNNLEIQLQELHGRLATMFGIEGRAIQPAAELRIINLEAAIRALFSILIEKPNHLNWQLQNAQKTFTKTLAGDS